LPPLPVIVSLPAPPFSTFAISFPIKRIIARATNDAIRAVGKLECLDTCDGISALD
jgi:hypothetical protein